MLLVRPLIGCEPSDLSLALLAAVDVATKRVIRMDGWTAV